MEEWKKIFGGVLWKVIMGEPMYNLDRMEWEVFYDEPYPWTREEWEKEIKGKSIFELFPKEPWNPSEFTNKGECDEK